MGKFIPREKMSKKAQKELNRKKRQLWEVSPVTKRVENARAYNRKKVQKGDYDFPFEPFLMRFTSSTSR